jgi:hypothetical protein
MYYYVSYACRYDGHWTYGGKWLKGIHPLLWVIAANHDVEQRYVVISWQEITEEEDAQFNCKI